MTKLSLRRRTDLPLAIQLIALLVVALLAAQAVTLALTLLLPPEAPQRWDLGRVAQALSGGQLSPLLQRKTMAGPPDINGPGWLVSESSRDALAARLHRPVDQVVLGFYTALPVGGVAAPSTRPKLGMAGSQAFTLIAAAHAEGAPGGATGMPMGGLPGGHFPGGGFPDGGFPGGHLPGGQIPGGSLPGGHAPSGIGNPATRAPGGGITIHAPAPNPAAILRVPLGLAGPSPITQPISLPTPLPAAALPPTDIPTIAPISETHPHVSPAAIQPTAAPIAVAPTFVPLAQPVPGEVARPASASVAPIGTPQPIPFRQTRSGLLNLASPPFIEGDFIAAARGINGQWIAVAPAAEPFPNRWQQQVLAWFLLSLAIVSPLAWLVARRIVTPLEGFARAAEALGRDPSSTIMPLSGPAEVGRAAHAFNIMQSRLHAFVDDRTAMAGAISHDLRTPLTRLRFRIEDVPDPVRAGLLQEVTEMEAMIAQVITFIRDASTPGARETVDFAELVRQAVRDAELVGGHIAFEGSAHLPVQVDPVGMRRLLGNLLENAAKYGEHTRVRVRLHDSEAVAEVVDDGPGVPEAEWEQVFEPFYRTESARRSGKPGNGLGLAVCRSIARAHGGDVAFDRAADGFVARLRVPLVYHDSRTRAA